MILDTISCKACKRELQPNDISVGTNDEGDLTKICMFCGHEECVE